MANVLVEESSLQAIADAIRYKTGGTDTYKPREMAPAIRNLPGPGVMQNLSVTENGDYTPEAGFNGYDFVSVAVPNSALSSTDEGKVVVNGALMPQTSLSVTANGTYDTTDKNSVVVNVNGSGVPLLSNYHDYIESTGTQWVDTGYLVKDSTRIEMVANISSSSTLSYNCAFGVRARNGTDAGTQGMLLCVKYNSRNCYINWGTGDKYFCDMTQYYNNIAAYLLTYSNPIIIDRNGMISGQVLFPTDHATQNRSLHLFALNDGGTVNSQCIMRLYSFRIYEGNSLVMDLVPAVDGSSVVCLRDTVSGNYLYNAGTGTFAFGTDS